MTAWKNLSEQNNEPGIAIQKKRVLDDLRVCYKAYLLENGSGLRYIQLLLGHNSKNTTEFYTYAARNSFIKI
nr:tyrosine-type recombinase/integrase [Zhouia amylolytica]